MAHRVGSHGFRLSALARQRGPRTLGGCCCRAGVRCVAKHTVLVHCHGVHQRLMRRHRLRVARQSIMPSMQASAIPDGSLATKQQGSRAWRQRATGGG